MILLVRVIVGTQKKATKVQKTNSNPRYDEYFVFNFFDSPQKLFEQLVQFRVYNAKSIFKDALIGAFSVCLFYCFSSASSTLFLSFILSIVGY